MWMVSPKIMCREHLLGEHRELHTLVAVLRKKGKIDGYIKNNCLEPLSIRMRHEELVNEMKYRGYNHNSKLGLFSLFYLSEENKCFQINKLNSLKELFKRCSKCRKNYKQILKQINWRIKNDRQKNRSKN